MKNRQTAKQEGILDEIKKTRSHLKLIDHNEFAYLWNPEEFKITNPPRFHRGIQSKIEQSLNEFHYAFSPLPDSYKVKILSGRPFQDFMNTIKQYTYITDKKQKHLDSEKLFSFNMYYDFFNIGMEGLIKTMPTDFQQYIDEQMRPILLLMQSISRFSNQKNSKKIPLVKAPKSMKNSSSADETLE